MGKIKFTQPVLIQKLMEEYKPLDSPVSKTPAVAGEVLIKGDGEGMVAIDLLKDVLVSYCNMHIYDAMVMSRYFQCCARTS